MASRPCGVSQGGWRGLEEALVVVGRAVVEDLSEIANVHDD